MLDDVAARAAVAVQTVYFHFGNKRNLLKEAVDVAAVGDDEPVALLERPWLEVVSNETDPRKIIELWAAEGRRIMHRVGPIMRVVRDARGTEPDLAAQWATNEQQQLAAFAMFAGMLDDLNALRPGLTVEEARDIIFAISGLETYLLLSSTCAWSLGHWEQRITDLLVRALLPS